MKKVLLVCLIIEMGVLTAGCPTHVDNPVPEPAAYSVYLNLSLQASNLKVVYAVWIEDEAGNNLQNLYVCNRVLGINPATGSLWQSGSGLTGDGIPHWLLYKYRKNDAGSGNKTVDGVTGASIQTTNLVQRNLMIGAVTRFRVCLEIDRSNNSNQYFAKDRPAFTYKSPVIDLSTAPTPYQTDLLLDGWMSNHTGYGNPFTQYSQQPIEADGTTVPDIPGYAPDTYMTDTSWIAQVDDMVSSLSVTVTKN